MANTAIDKALAPGNSPGDGTGDASQKLALELSLLGGGVAQGAWAKTREFAQHPITNTLEVGAASAAMAGAGYAVARFLPEVMGAAKYAFAAAALLQTAPGLATAASAAIDTWSDPSRYRANKDLVADKLGRPLFDLALYSAVGAGSLWKGAAHGKIAAEVAGSLELQATRRTAATHIPFLRETGRGEASITQIRLGKDPQLAELYAKGSPSIVQLMHKPVGGKGSWATGFAVGDDLIATNNHVLYAHVPTMVKLNSGEIVEAKLVARDKDADLALLRLPQGTLTGRALELGSSAGLQSGSRLYMIGHPRNVSVAVASAGRLNGTHGMKFLNSSVGEPDTHFQTERFFQWGLLHDQKVLMAVTDAKEPAQIIRREILSHDVVAQPGNSGSPVFDGAGRVVAVHSTGDRYKWSTSVAHLKALVGAYKAEPVQDGWINVVSHARPRPKAASGRFFDPVITASLDVLSIKKFAWRAAPQTPTE